jgi:hypothetical protein
MKVHGKCHCGQITYSAEIDPAAVYLCHCSDCQILTGSAYRTNVPAPSESFVLHAGEPKSYIKTADSGNKRRHAFCSNCGSPVYSCDINEPKTFSLRVGCLDERAQLRPQRQIWCDSALAWSNDLSAIHGIARQ